MSVNIVFHPYLKDVRDANINLKGENWNLSIFSIMATRMVTKAGKEAKCAKHFFFSNPYE